MFVSKVGINRAYVIRLFGVYGYRERKRVRDIVV